MAFYGQSAGAVVILAAAIVSFFHQKETVDSSVADAFVASVSALNSAQLEQRIVGERQSVGMNQAMLDSLQAPAPIYATERSALPVNKREIADYQATIKAYSTALAIAKTHLRVLDDAKAATIADAQAHDGKLQEPE